MVIKEALDTGKVDDDLLDYDYDDVCEDIENIDDWGYVADYQFDILSRLRGEA